MRLYIKKVAPWILVAIFFITFDRFLKNVSLNYFQFRELELLGGILKFDFVANKYIAFSLPITGPILIILNFLIVFFLLYILFRFIKKQYWHYSGSIIFIILGGSSNIYDRLMFGYVIDYINLKWFTVFNLADTMIVLGSLFIGAKMFKEEKNKRN